MYKKYIKRIFDIIFSFILLVLLSPLLVFISLLILLFLGKPVLFTQIRPGLNENLFKIYKFRSMLNTRDENGELLPNEERLTRFGNLLRKSSLDEIPELFNVLKGDMSFIGPRPLIIRYLPYYTIREKTRHEVRPGITGLAQVNGRNFLDWDSRLEMDAYYVENLTFLLDLRIFFKTIFAVMKHKDVGLDVITDLDMAREKIKNHS